MSFRPIYEGWDVPGHVSRHLRQRFSGFGLNRDQAGAVRQAEAIWQTLIEKELDSAAGQAALAESMASAALERLGADTETTPFRTHITDVLADLIVYEGWFAIPDFTNPPKLSRSELWQIEDQLKRVAAIVDELDTIIELVTEFTVSMIAPLIADHPRLLTTSSSDGIPFTTNLLEVTTSLPTIMEQLIHLPFAPEFEPLVLLPRLRDRLEYNLHIVSGGVPGDTGNLRTLKLPTKQSAIPDQKLAAAYLDGTPLQKLFDHSLTVTLPPTTRFEHHHIVAGSGHGKTQTIQHLIRHDLEAVAAGAASIIVIDSQSDLINNIAGLESFAPGQPLADRLVHIDPTDLEWPVALNLFDVGLDRLDQYSPLDRERLTNSILELYDFVLGSLLDAAMTQKQTVIFRYITRLLLHIPGATIHTLRELLEDGGSDRYRSHMQKLQGSARAFFEHEFDSKEFQGTKRQVLRRLYGILENQTFERMFSHPKSKLDLFSEMNAGKVILINTAKDLLKESGTEIFGRFFIAMIAQAAQERAVLTAAKRLPTFVYIDEANDYFDRNIGIILSQARKYNIGVILSHQFLGQLDTKLHEAIAANTAIKFAGGVSAKDARALAGDLRTDAGFIESQSKLHFAAFIKGQTERAVSLHIIPTSANSDSGGIPKALIL
uniref:type IV secretory system conjugative DNA transfer family protein n=1 Tax=Pararhizobium sp. IMCC3301 TaxID=3067904 RepID=UPI0027407232|nr:type IV secretory system conjugative DNA transfer family protein [Pararhizobium sp. IMCC3301]